MEISNSIVLSSALVHYVLAVILIGILITEYAKRAKKYRGGIASYIGLFIIILIFYLLDMYRNLLAPSVLINWICLFLAFLANALFILVTFKYLKNINKILFFSIPPFSLGIVVVEILRILYPDKSFDLYTSFTTIIATTLAYLLIIGFLINTAKRTVNNKQKM